MRQKSNRMITEEQKNAICQRIRELRREQGYSQRELAGILGLERSSYAYYELGRVQISIDVLCALTQLYGVSADYILALSDEKHPGGRKDPLGE
ncbi:MAG: helix-turn-helix transcriptional regulator [Clostridiales bacterium]|nr:helix-turn-helix transcriptional regulator [Clostridiales bacterium]